MSDYHFFVLSPEEFSLFGITCCLNVWWNSLVKASGPRVNLNMYKVLGTDFQSKLVWKFPTIFSVDFLKWILIFDLACFCYCQRRPSLTVPETRSTLDLFLTARSSRTAPPTPDCLNQMFGCFRADSCSLTWEVLVSCPAKPSLWTPKWSREAAPAPCLRRSTQKTHSCCLLSLPQRPQSHICGVGEVLLITSLPFCFQLMKERGQCWQKEMLTINPEGSRSGKCGLFLQFTKNVSFPTLSMIKLRSVVPKEKTSSEKGE